MKRPFLEHKMEEYIKYLVEEFLPRCYNEKPVILHSIRVANCLYEMNYSEDIVLGALLHDVVEDSTITIEDIAFKFGDKKAKLVDSLTEDKSISDKIKRNENLIDKSVDYGFESLIIKCSDILDNSNYHYLVSEKKVSDRLFKKYDYFMEKASDIENEPIYIKLKDTVEELKKKMGERV